MSLWEDHFRMEIWGLPISFMNLDVSWTYLLPRFKKVPVIISLNKLFTPFSLAVSTHSSSFRILHWCISSDASWWHARAQTSKAWTCCCCGSQVPVERVLWRDFGADVSKCKYANTFGIKPCEICRSLWQLCWPLVCLVGKRAGVFYRACVCQAGHSLCMAYISILAILSYS